MKELFNIRKFLVYSFKIFLVSDISKRFSFDLRELQQGLKNNIF